MSISIWEKIRVYECLIHAIHEAKLADNDDALGEYLENIRRYCEAQLLPGTQEEQEKFIAEQFDNLLRV